MKNIWFLFNWKQWFVEKIWSVYGHTMNYFEYNASNEITSGKSVKREVNTCKYREAEWRKYASVIWPSLVKIMACRPVGVLGNKLQWNFNLNSNVFFQENAFEDVVWKMAAILSRPECVKQAFLWNQNRNIWSGCNISSRFAYIFTLIPCGFIDNIVSLYQQDSLWFHHSVIEMELCLTHASDEHI